MIKRGRRKTLIAGCFIVILGSLVSLVKEYWTICVGRFILGLGSGLSLASTPKMIEETIPAHVVDKGFGVSTNVAVNVAILINSAVAFGMPKSQEQLKSTGYWRLIYCIPIVMNAFALILISLLHKQDSLMFLI